MDKENHFITEPEELISWMKEHGEFKQMNKDDAQILLNYMEGHDYRLSTDKEGNLVRVDVNSEEHETEPYSLDDVIDIVCEWNYELLSDSIEELEVTVDEKARESIELKIMSLRQDEFVLDKLFDQTKYASQIDVLANEIVASILSRMGVSGIDLAVKEIGEAVRTGVMAGGVR